MPGGWIYIANFGIRQMDRNVSAMVASVGLAQDNLEPGSGLAEYIEKQKKLVANTLKGAKSAGPQPTTFSGADEAQLFIVRHEMESVGTVIHVQSYVRFGLWLGIITLTALEAQLKAVRPDYEAFVKGLHIAQQRASELDSYTKNNSQMGKEDV